LNNACIRPELTVAYVCINHALVLTLLLIPLQEAAILVREGEENDKFFHHPKGRWSKLAFFILHHPAYYITHLIVTTLLMLLALLETPPSSGINDSTKKVILLVWYFLKFALLWYWGIYIV
jgi:two pore calcium channel protein 1